MEKAIHDNIKIFCREKLNIQIVQLEKEVEGDKFFYGIYNDRSIRVRLRSDGNLFLSDGDKWIHVKNVIFN